MASQQISNEAAREWLSKKGFPAFDSLDANNVEKLFAEDAVLRFAGNPEVKGRENIKAFFTSIFPLLTSMNHTLTHIDTIENRIYQHSDIIYVIKNDTQLPSEILVKGLAVSWFEEVGGWEEGKKGELVLFEVFADPTVLNERFKGVSDGVVEGK